MLVEAWKWFVSQQRNPTNTVYHYTDEPALLSIIEHKKMWATDLRFMNDEKELTYSHKLIQAAITDAADRQRDPQRAKWLSVFDDQFRAFAATCRWYSMSFCQEFDLPSQWGEYGASGFGFALGWSIDTLPDERPMQIEVVYEAERQTFLIRKLLNLHIVALREKKDLRRGRGLDELLYVSGSLANFFNILLYNFKEAKWVREREIRYVYQTLTDTPPAGMVLKYRKGEGDIQKPYIESDFREIPLRVVIAGPKVDDVAFQRVRSALTANGYAQAVMYRSTSAVG
jgi:hypothetical protein